jgi:hypothetical protein
MLRISSDCDAVPVDVVEIVKALAETAGRYVRRVRFKVPRVLQSDSLHNFSVVISFFTSHASHPFSKVSSQIQRHLLLV